METNGNHDVDNNIYLLSKKFALRIINLYSFLTKEKKEYVISKQLLRSGTSIGANVHEGKNAQSRADFCSKKHRFKGSHRNRVLDRPTQRS